MDVLLLLLLFFFMASAPRSLSSSQHDHLTYQWLHVSPLEEHHSAAAAAAAAAREQQLPSAPWRNTTKLALRIMHRDSPSSPLADPLATPEELLLQRLNRDEARAAALSSRAKLASLQGYGDLSYAEKKNGGSAAQDGFSSPVSSGFAEGSGEYFIRLGVGTPPAYTTMVMDTGSDVVWIQCSPCLDCYKQSDPVFDPATSASYRKLSCRAPACSMLQLHGCAGGGGGGGGGGQGQCLYQVAYGDGSFTAGDFAAEVLRFGAAAAARIAIGCGHDNEGLFAGAGGLLGLGGGALSFPSQLGRRYSRVFSYCLMDRDREGHSTLEFGGRGAMPRGTMYTPMIRNAKLDTFYYVSMNGISVGGQLLAIPERVFTIDESGGGGVIVDSGTSVSRLVEAAYGPLRSAFKATTAGLLFVGGYWPFDTCYDLSGHRPAARMPTLSLHFQGGAELALPTSNYFIPVDSRGTYCLAFASTSGDLSIIGNIQQQGFRVIFDSASARVGFAPNQC